MRSVASVENPKAYIDKFFGIYFIYLFFFRGGGDRRRYFVRSVKHLELPPLRMHSTLYGIRECGYTVPASEPNASVTDCSADGRHACHITGAIKQGREVNTWKEIKKRKRKIRGVFFFAISPSSSDASCLLPFWNSRNGPILV